MRYFFGLVNNWVKFFGENLQSLVLLMFRLVWGYSFFETGLGKFLHLTKAAGAFKEIGIPFPEASAFIVAFVECFGGLCLLFGLGTRLSALALSVVMLVAYSTAHVESVKNFFMDPLGVTQEAPFPFLVASLVLLAFGPGRVSLDYLLFERKSKGP